MKEPNYSGRFHTQCKGKRGAFIRIGAVRVDLPWTDNLKSLNFLSQIDTSRYVDISRLVRVYKSI